LIFRKIYRWRRRKFSNQRCVWRRGIIRNPLLRGDFDRLVDAIARAEKPLLYVGGGAITSNAYKEIRELAEKAEIPVYMTLMGLGAFPAEHKLSLGMAGMHGTAYANKAIQECDFMLALGSRFDDRVALNVSDYGAKATRAMIDIDQAEINKRIAVDIHIVGDLKDVLIELVKRVKKQTRKNWVERITTDVGQHQMWAAQFYKNDPATTGSAPAVPARWASASPPPSVRSSPAQTRRSSPSPATAASR
jgi:thiamine pyrophosphate-dependent acetolactate synthase large subunit-like protein